MTPSRETVMSALFTALQTAQGFASYSRRMALAPDVPKEKQPALILYETMEINDRTLRGTPTANTLFVDIVIFARVPHAGKWSPEQPGGAEVLNPLMDAVEAALPTNPFGNDLTLGGIVYRVVPDEQRQTIKDVGDTEPNGQAVAVMPYKIIVP